MLLFPRSAVHWGELKSCGHGPRNMLVFLGDFQGKAWRIGLMGASATPRHVELCLGALEEALR